MRGFTPHPDREPLYMGLRPMPHLGIFFGKKIPKNPKKPNCIGFKPSNTDSEQGCRRQPCFFARRRQHGTATAPTPRAPAVPPAPAARRAAPHSPAVSPAPTPFRTASAATAHAPPEPVRLLAEVLKLQDFSFYQSISNFVVSLPNLSKRREGTTFP